jgi:hypothetical protein
MVAFSASAQNLLEQHWRGDGLLERVQNKTCAAWLEYDQDGLVSRVIHVFDTVDHGLCDLETR